MQCPNSYPSPHVQWAIRSAIVHPACYFQTVLALTSAIARDMSIDGCLEQRKIQALTCAFAAQLLLDQDVTVMCRRTASLTLLLLILS